MTAVWHPSDGTSDHESLALEALDRAADAHSDLGAQALVDAAQVHATLAVADRLRDLHDLLDAGFVKLQAAIEAGRDERPAG